MKTNLTESTIPENYTQKLTSMTYEWDPTDTKKVVEVIFTAISDFLAIVKSKITSKALVFKDLKGEFLLGAVVSYVPNEENPDSAGSWEYEYVVKEEYLPEEVDVILATDSQFQYVFFTTGDNLYGLVPRGNSTFYPLCITVIETILEWLRSNASDSNPEEVDLLHDGFFIANAKVDPDTTEVLISIAPDQKMKEIVKKGDADIEKEQ